MNLFILGPLEVVTSGAAVPISGRLQRTLLCLLVLHPGKPVTTDAIAAALWPTRLPTDTQAAIRFHIWKLRSTLSDADPGAIGTVSCGYLLDVDPSSVDAVRFATMVTEARNVLAESPADAHELASKAVTMWRGEALADVGYEEFAQVAIRRLTALRLESEAIRIDALFALERHREALADLEALTEEHPLAERFWIQLVAGLRQVGRRAEAVAQCHRMRRWLTAEMGSMSDGAIDATVRAMLDDGLVSGAAGRTVTAKPAASR